MIPTSAKSIIVLDFETTGLSPNQGDRAIEIGAVKLQHGKVIDSFQQLMNPGFRVSSFIEGYTGITNNMLKQAPSNQQVMNEFSDFIQNSHLVAHNASFDQRFLDAELELINRSYNGQFVCSLLVARRLIQDAPSHKLGELVKHRHIDNDGVFHRALADAEVTAKLWLSMVEDVEQHTHSDVTFALMKTISQTKKSAIGTLLRATKQS
ncbi:3'-5' exonuclease [Vibrio genomosp. F10 str. 9ZC157]|uniref:DNA-directed DNA polymerase n=1 Tax=Vibrio genomosp. F10 str. ZF-129 TaxID=1187848 RepID=A0A1E5BGX1_9VIBR|nr:3'-5' exonuclease [Vibrio genomosp. F10]OEE35951.1 DNA polymerase III subunit epsilon [Vibrio genomosp. F10 str. ZF-129]OEE92984.1 DNA polymerase III subunit epsilon [Vibrio genomosp. F10 str. 9ZC157]